MLVTTTLTIPASTAKANAITSELLIPAGTITNITGVFPKGHHNLTRLQIELNGSKIYPAAGVYVTADDMPVKSIEDIKVGSGSKIKAIGWNDDDTYAHQITIFIEILPPDVARTTQPDPLRQQSPFIKCIK